MTNSLVFVVKTTIVTLVATLLVPFLFIFNEGLSNFAYREVGYYIVADKLQKNTSSDEEFLTKVVSYINQNIYPVGELQDKTTWNDLVIGQAWCDQVSRDVAEILAKKNIPARIIMDAGTSHSVGEAFIDGKFRFYDAQNNYIFRNLSGELATFEDVANGNIDLKYSKISADIKSSEDLFELHPYLFKTDDDYDLKKYSGLVIDPAMGKNRWKVYTDVYGPMKNFISYLVWINYTINPWFYGLYQDLFLGYYSKISAVHIGRNYELFGRYDKALQFYNQSLMSESSQEDGLFYIGRMFHDLGDYKKSINYLVELLEHHPKTKWKDPSNYILGESYELLGKEASARHYYNKSRKPYYGSSNKLFNKIYE